MSKPCGIRRIDSNCWEAWIYEETFVGTYDECMAWLYNHGEESY